MQVKVKRMKVESMKVKRMKVKRMKVESMKVKRMKVESMKVKRNIGGVLLSPLAAGIFGENPHPVCESSPPLEGNTRCTGGHPN